MLVACWSAKGGAGTSVVAAALAVLAGRRSPHGAVLADLAGVGPALLGVPEPDSPGLTGWLAAAITETPITGDGRDGGAKVTQGTGR